MSLQNNNLDIGPTANTPQLKRLYYYEQILKSGVIVPELENLVNEDVERVYWRLVNEGKISLSPTQINVLDMGAVGDGVTDDTLAIQAVIDSIPSSGGTIYFPAGTYIITSALVIKSGINIVGDGPRASIIHQNTAAENCFTGVDIIHLNISNIKLEGPNAGTGRGISLTRSLNAATNYIVLTNLYIRAFGAAGIWISNPIVSTFTNVITESNRGHGFHLVGEAAVAGTSVTFSSCYANNNLGSGYYLDTMAYSTLVACASEGHIVDFDTINCLGVTYTGCGSERNKGKSWNISGGYGTTIVGGWIFMNSGIGVHVQNDTVANSIIGLVDTEPTIDATAFIKTEVGTKCLVSNFRTTGTNSFAADTVHLVADQAMNARFAGSINVPNTITLKDIANLYGNAETDNTIPRVQTDQSLYIGNTLKVFGDANVVGVFRFNGDTNFYRESVGILKTDGSLKVVGQINIGADAHNLYQVDATTMATDSSFHVGNQILAYGDIRAHGGLGVNGNLPVYKTAAPTGTDTEKITAIIAKLQEIGIYT